MVVAVVQVVDTAAVVAMVQVALAVAAMVLLTQIIHQREQPTLAVVAVETEHLTLVLVDQERLVVRVLLFFATLTHTLT